MADYLAIDDLYALVGSQKVIQLFDDDGSGTLAGGELTNVTKVLDDAESFAASRLLRSYSSTESITILADNDVGFTSQVAWIALEFASERRPEFLGNEGKGQFWAQYERAVSYLDSLSKGKTRSRGEAVAGVGANIGGTLQPTLDSGTPRFTFSPDDDYPTGHGGF